MSSDAIATTQHALERAMRRIAKQQERELADLHVCYEASGCGFWIARRLLQMGLRCDVIAPSLIPTRYNGKTHWTQSHRNYLRDLKLPDAVCYLWYSPWVVASIANFFGVRYI